MNAAHRLWLGPRCIRKTRNHTFLSVTFIFICASSTHPFLSLFFSLLEIITSRVSSLVIWRGRKVSHCLLSLWLSKWHRISSRSCLPLWHYNYPQFPLSFTVSRLVFYILKRGWGQLYLETKLLLFFLNFIDLFNMCASWSHLKNFSGV